MAGEGFSCDIARFEERVIVGVGGAVDSTTAPELERRVRAVLTAPLVAVVIDLAYITVLDPDGVGALVRLRQRAAELGSDFQLTALPRPIERALVRSGAAAELGLSARTRRRRTRALARDPHTSS